MIRKKALLIKIENKISKCLDNINNQIKFYIDKNEKGDSGTIFPIILSGLILLEIKDTKFYNNETAESLEIIYKLILKNINQEYLSLNYLFKNPNKNIVYPDDIDDTFNALKFLNLYNPELINGEKLSKIIHLLFETELKGGGPYNTWINAKKSKDWQDVDIVCNCVVKNFFNSININTEKLDSYIEKYLSGRKLYSKYYHRETYILYYIIKSCKNNEKIIKLADGMLRNKIKHINDLDLTDKLLTVTSILNLNVDLPFTNKVIANIVNRQIKAESLYIERNKDETIYFEEEFITNSIYLESLIKFHNKYKKQIVKSTNIEERIVNTVKGKLLNELWSYGITSRNIKRILGNNDSLYEEIILTPYFWNELVRTKRSKKSSQADITRLGLMNLYGWLSYTIFDSINDNENSKNLTCAAIQSHYEFFKILNNFTNTKTKKYFYEILDLNNLSFKNIPKNFNKIEEISNKSIGHVISPLLINKLNNKHYDLFSQTKKFFVKYLTIKQINDDLHDWEEDIRNGNKTPITEKLKSYFPKKHNNLKDLNKAYKERVLMLSCNKIIKISKEALCILYEISITNNKKDKGKGYLDNIGYKYFKDKTEHYLRLAINIRREYEAILLLQNPES